MTRREFAQSWLALGTAALGGARGGRFTLQPPGFRHEMQGAPTSRGGTRQAPVLDPATLRPFVNPLPRLPAARPASYRLESGERRPYYRLRMMPTARRVHRDLPPTRFWGFDAMSPGPTIEAHSGQGLWIEWVNDLPANHFLPVDRTIHGAEADKPEVRAVIHVHGAKVKPEADGYPTKWLVPGQAARYYYPNAQQAATLWYHDHTMGINRLNMMAGLMGMYLVRDAAELALNLPKGPCEIPLMLCDRMLGVDGQLVYPTSDNPEAPWIPEFMGDVVLVNGMLFPFLDVEPRRYRFRIVNGSNSRFVSLSLAGAQPFQQIGTDQGLLPGPVQTPRVDLAPAERADVVVDFADSRGEAVVLKNDMLPVMQFRVSRTRVDDTSSLPRALRPLSPLPEAASVRTRLHTLREIQDRVARPMQMLLNGSHWDMPVTEDPVLDTVEIWSLVNVTDDSHPIHLHLVRFQILDRRQFEPFAFLNGGTLKYLGPPIPPEPTEAGWKDTVRADARMVTRIIIRFDGYAGRYMWHCHLLEHGDNEMMRPFDVLPSRVR
jgi:spore coat protein A, manganese oxidase